MAKKTFEKPNIFKYQDFREFLRHYFSYARKNRTGVTRDRIAVALHVSSSFLSMVLAGKRSLSVEHLPVLSKNLKLSPSEARYFEALILKSRSHTEEAVIDSLKRMGNIKSFRNQNPKEAEVFRYLTHWYYVAIREMTALPGFTLDAAWIQKHMAFPISIKEIETALKFLIENKYIEITKTGAIAPPDKHLDCMNGVYAMALIQFHKEMFALASRSISKIAPSERNIVGFTFSGDREAYDKANKVIEYAHEELKKIALEAKSGDSVFHLEMGLFPLTQKSEEKD